MGNKNPKLIIENAMLLLTVQLYALSISRTDIQRVTEIFSDFITNMFIPFLKDRFDENLNQAVDDLVKEEIHKILSKFGDPFENFNTEKNDSIFTKILVYMQIQQNVQSQSYR